MAPNIIRCCVNNNMNQEMESKPPHNKIKKHSKLEDQLKGKTECQDKACVEARVSPLSVMFEEESTQTENYDNIDLFYGNSSANVTEMGTTRLEGGRGDNRGDMTAAVASRLQGGADSSSSDMNQRDRSYVESSNRVIWNVTDDSTSCLSAEGGRESTVIERLSKSVSRLLKSVCFL